MEKSSRKANAYVLFYCLAMALLANGAFASERVHLAGKVYESESGNIVISFLNDREGQIQRGDSVIDFTYSRDDLHISFEGENLPLAFSRIWVLAPDGEWLGSGDRRIRTSIRRPWASPSAEELSDSDSTPPRCSYHQLRDIEEHGHIVHVQHISRGMSCPYPWERYTFVDGYKCDQRHPCH